MQRVVCLLIILSLPACSVVNSVRLLNANNDVQPEWTSQLDQVKLSTKFIGEQMFVDANINGLSGFRFLVDSGASIPCLMTTDKIKQLPLKKGYEIEIGGNGNEDPSPAYTTQIEKLKIGPVQFDEITFCVIPIEFTGYYLRTDEALFDGVIGTDLLDHFAIQIDAAENQVLIFREYSPIKATDIAIAMEKSWGKYTIEATVILKDSESKTVNMIVDSGSRNYIKLNESLLADLPKNSKQITAADFGLSGRNIHQRALIPSLKIADLEVNNIRANFIHDEDDDDITYIIGNALLNQFVVTFDMPNETLYLRKSDNSNNISKFNLVGLQLRKTQSGLFVVRNIIQQLPAAKLDFKEGDLISIIDGKSAKETTLASWIERAADKRNLDICRLRDEKEQCFVITPRAWYQ